MSQYIHFVFIHTPGAQSAAVPFGNEFTKYHLFIRFKTDDQNFVENATLLIYMEIIFILGIKYDRDVG